MNFFAHVNILDCPDSLGRFKIDNFSSSEDVNIFVKVNIDHVKEFDSVLH